MEIRPGIEFGRLRVLCAFVFPHYTLSWKELLVHAIGRED